MAAAMPPPNNKVSQATAKVIPVLVALIVAYASYVVIGPLAVQYLLNPPPGRPRRITVGLAIPIAYGVLLIPVAVTWLRLLLVVWREPGYTSPGPKISEPTEPEQRSGLEEFWHLDVFACDSRGLPIWCPYCENWKPDRTHHNQDVGRCTLKMDHFCPWVGGVVGERSYKFFIQFNFYSFLLCAYTLGVLAYFVAEGKERDGLKVHWLVALGLGGFFTLFTFGIVVNSLWMTFRNVTTIENIDVHLRTMLLAVALPPDMQGIPAHLQDKLQRRPPPLTTQEHMGQGDPSSRSSDSDRPLTSDLNDPSHSTYFSNLQTGRPQRRSSTLPFQDRIWKGIITYPLTLDPDRPPLPAPQPRTFAILETLPGMNPWDIGSSYLNFKSVFGERPHDWLLPVKHSPCCDHSSLVSQYPLGPDFEELLIEAGLAPRPNDFAPREDIDNHHSGSSAASRKRKRRRRLDPGWQDGERPDGWFSEKEARRMRHDTRRRTRERSPSQGPYR